MRALIITADDYGFTTGVNSGIEACVRAGLVQSVCVMPNMPHWESAANLRTINPSVSIGVHWTVTQGKPLLPPHAVPSLVDIHGEFHPYRAFRQKAYAGLINFHELKAELAAQVEQLRRVVPETVYWNSHHGVHVHPRLYWVFLHVARRFSILGMRNHARITGQGRMSRFLYLAAHPSIAAKLTVVHAMGATARARGFRMPAGLLADIGSGRGDSKVIESVRARAWQGVAEIAIHPASDIETLTGRSIMLDSRLAEFRTFSSSDVARDLHCAGVELTNFEAALRPEGV